jgi:alpha-glucosidase (family GH31 glycosyl hydrolase)
VADFNFLKHSISGIFNYNIFGIPFIGADICAFHDNATDELCARWHVLGAFYPFSRNHNVDTSLSQEPWVFNSLNRRSNINKFDVNWPKEGYTLLAAQKAIRIKYTLLRYTYTQIFLISLGYKAAYFKPCFFEFPDDSVLINEMNVLNTHIMLGDSLLFIPSLTEHESSYLGYFPNSNFNKFPEGTKITDFVKNRNMGQFKELKGGYLDINLFLRGGKIIPFQNKTNITSTNDLRNIRTSLIINPDHNKQANGYVIYDSDDIDPIANKTYLHVGINFNKDIIKFFLINIGIKNNNNIDDIVEDIIIYRASELNAKIYQYAVIETHYGKNERVKMEYKKENDILIIKYIQIPIYIITSIKLE